MSYRIGVDIGGTFADFCALDEATGRLATLKVLSTPDEPGREVITGLAELGTRFGVQPKDIGYFTHGTTVGINSVIQRKGIRLCLFTTATTWPSRPNTGAAAAEPPTTNSCSMTT